MAVCVDETRNDKAPCAVDHFDIRARGRPPRADRNDHAIPDQNIGIL
jgi:hypothetical protein